MCVLSFSLTRKEWMSLVISSFSSMDSEYASAGSIVGKLASRSLCVVPSNVMVPSLKSI